MNIKEYISGGNVENYVLGLASDEERAEFERLCLQYPELVSARLEFEEELEKQALENAITPAPQSKEKIFTRLLSEEKDKVETGVIPINSGRQNINWYRYVAAAAVLFLFISTYFAYSFYSENQKLQQSYGQLRDHIDSLQEIVAQIKPGLNLNDAVVVSMSGTEKPASTADIYWDTASHDVYLVVRNLPKLPTEKQYQLWAFIDGQPKNLGLFDWDNKNVILKMRNTSQAEAFAITVEDRGNGDVPHGSVETMGKL